MIFINKTPFKDETVLRELNSIRDRLLNSKTLTIQKTVPTGYLTFYMEPGTKTISVEHEAHDYTLD